MASTDSTRFLNCIARMYISLNMSWDSAKVAHYAYLMSQNNNKDRAPVDDMRYFQDPLYKKMMDVEEKLLVLSNDTLNQIVVACSHVPTWKQVLGAAGMTPQEINAVAARLEMASL